MVVRSGDTVQVVAGKDKGLRGRIIRVLPAANRVVVEGVNIRTFHRKPTQRNPQGGIEKLEAPLNASNVMIVCPKTDQPTRVRMEVGADGVKYRVSVKGNCPIETPTATKEAAPVKKATKTAAKKKEA